jgi:hypothetical protein
MAQVPVSEPASAEVEAVADPLALAEGRSRNGAGALPSMKWIYTNGPATAATTMTATPPMSQRSQGRFLPDTALPPGRPGDPLIVKVPPAGRL